MEIIIRVTAQSNGGSGGGGGDDFHFTEKLIIYWLIAGAKQ